jgi:hypothetical protein
MSCKAAIEVLLNVDVGTILLEECHHLKFKKNCVGICILVPLTAHLSSTYVAVFCVLM